MRRWIRPVTAALVAAAMGVAGLPAHESAQADRAEAGAPARATTAAQDAGRAGPSGVLPPGGRWTVTLLTGEVVDVTSDADGRVSARVRLHDGPFRLLRLPDGEVHVIPLAVTALLDDVLDPELFNVTGLVRQGYDDEGLDSVPLIVEREPGTDVQARVASPDERPLPSIGAVAVEVPKADTGAAQTLVDQLAAEATPGARVRPTGVTRVWLDRRVTLSRADQLGQRARSARSSHSVREAAPMQEPRLDENLTQVGADDAWEAGFTGEGTTVAVLDTGVDPTHPDLAGRIVAQENFADAEDALDHVGHGTHVAALVAGTGAAASGARRGVAPDARLISGKVTDDFGFGFESQAIAGMEWAAPQADVVNMSLGYGLGSDGSDPISVALDTLSEQHGTLFVVAAGNSGPSSRSVDVPGVADRALTVGAVDADDALADFSSRGPVATSYELKPEVVAPGVDIVAARAAGTAMGDPVDDTYTAASGTSMATPHVAGAAAVLAQEHPDWDADELKNTIVGSAVPLDDDGYDVGAGRVDIGLGVASTVRPGRDAVEAALPEPRTEPGTEALTWANDGDEPVTVALDAALEDRRGDAVDEVSVEPAELTIAPHATASATLTVDGPDLDNGLYTGAVTATSDGEAVRTPVAVHAAPETVDLTITATSPAGGSATPRTFVSVVNLDDYGLYGASGGFQGDSVTLPVPAGRYAVVGDVSSADRDEQVVAQVGDPDVTIDEDTTVAFDGAAAQPLRPRIEGVDTAPPMYASANLQITPAAGTDGQPLYTEVYSWRPMPAVLVTPMEADGDHFAASQTYRLQAPHLTVRVGDEAIPVADVDDRHLPALGEHAYVAVDAGDGADLSAARGRLAVVTVPADPVERAAVTRRAADAGVAVLAFVDDTRRFLTLNAGGPGLPELHWSDVPVVVATGEGASRLRAAAANGDALTVTVAASPDVYDIVGPDADRVDPEPVVSRSEQRRLATISERFHRDADGTGANRDRRYSEINLMNLDSAGPLPERRTSHVSPGVRWQSMAVAPAVSELFGELVTGSTAVSMDEGRTYEPGSRHRVTWVRRPQWPGPVGDIPLGLSFCQPTPVARTADLLQVWLSAFQDRLDGFGCGSALEGSSLTLERDGQVVPERDEGDFPIPDAGEFPIPAEPGNYRLTYEGVGEAPYVHRSTTTWTFRSEAPAGDDRALIPLLVVGYQLPLDTLNRPTGDTATLTVRQVTGAPESPVRQVRAWTSTDDGATWRPAPVEHRQGSEYRLRPPRAARGTGISLRVAAGDAAGATIEQTLIDAYTA